MKARIPTAKFPELCPMCVVSLQMNVMDGHTRQHMKWCPHNLALGLASAHLGAIVSWQMVGPTTPEEAQSLVARFEAAATAAGVNIINPDSTLN